MESGLEQYSQTLSRLIHLANAYSKPLVFEKGQWGTKISIGTAEFLTIGGELIMPMEL